MTTVKEELMYTAKTLPDTASLDDAMYRLYVLSRFHQAEQEELAGETVSIDELRKEIETW